MEERGEATVAEAAAPGVVVGLVTAPGTPAELGRWLAGELQRELAVQHAEVS